jgi:hypothetical protein
MSVEHNDEPAPKPGEDTTPLAPGVWITEATGFASVPPRAQSDLCEVRKGEGEGEGERKGEAEAQPRIERYPER